MTANGDSWIQNLMDVCQFDNPFSKHEVPYPTVNKEQVLMPLYRQLQNIDYISRIELELDYSRLNKKPTY